MNQKLLYIFTRTPLHVGAGSSVGAVDLPVQRERHTGFPIIPASSLKGSFADQWPTTLKNKDNESVRLTTKKVKDSKGKEVNVVDQASAAAWLFGSDTTDLSFGGSLLFGEARIIAFPIRSARGSFAWITCPLALQRAKRDGIKIETIPDETSDDLAIFKKDGPLDLDGKIVLEEYCLNASEINYPDTLASNIASLVDDEVFDSIKERLVIVSNGVFTHFVNTACEVAQHVRISDETGTAEGTGLFNQENVPADTLFYSVINATKSRLPKGDFANKTPHDALIEFAKKIEEGIPFQFGANATTGLGFCTLSTNISTSNQD